MVADDVVNGVVVVPLVALMSLWLQVELLSWSDDDNSIKYNPSFVNIDHKKQNETTNDDIP